MQVRCGLIVLTMLASMAFAQQRPSQELTAAVACTYHKGPFGVWAEKPANAKVITAGYVLDVKDYPGERHLLLAVFKDHHSGQIFDFHVSRGGGKRVFSIENNANFAASGKRVQFPDPPLGGVWTQDRLASHVREIDQGTRISIPFEKVKDLPADVVCTSYADPERQK